MLTKGLACQDCGVNFTTIGSFKQHVRGKEHQKRVAELFQTEEFHGQVHLSTILVLQYLASTPTNTQKPVIGLCLVTMCLSTQGRESFYLCHACEENLNQSHIIDHLISTDHLINYYNYTDPDMLSFSWLPSTDMSNCLRPLAAKEMEKNGPGVLRVLNMPEKVFHDLKRSSYSKVMQALTHTDRLERCITADRPERRTIQEYHRDPNRKHPLLGLHSLVEYCCEGSNLRMSYLCQLCQLPVSFQRVIKHMLSFDHLYWYFKAYHPSTLLTKDTYVVYSCRFQSIMLDLANQAQEIGKSASKDIQRIVLEPEVFSSVPSSYKEAMRKLESIREERKEACLKTRITPGCMLVPLLDRPKSTKDAVTSGAKAVAETSHLEENLIPETNSIKPAAVEDKTATTTPVLKERVGQLRTVQLHCQNCMKTCVAVSTFKSHVHHWKHKMRLEGGPVRSPPFVLCQYLRSADQTEPLIGAHMVEMCVSTDHKDKPVYLCHICQESYTTAFIVPHLKSASHRQRTLMYQNPTRLPFGWSPQMDRELLKTLAWEMERDSGTKPLTLKVCYCPASVFIHIQNSYSAAVECLKDFHDSQKIARPLSFLNYLNKQGRKFPLLGLQFLVQYSVSSSRDSFPGWGFLCLLCEKKLSDGLSVAHVLSYEHVTRFLKHAHPGSLEGLVESDKRKSEMLLDLAQQAEKLHKIERQQVIKLQYCIAESVLYEKAISTLKAVTRREGKGLKIPHLQPGKRLVPFTGSQGQSTSEPTAIPLLGQITETKDEKDNKMKTNSKPTTKTLSLTPKTGVEMEKQIVKDTCSEPSIKTGKETSNDPSTMTGKETGNDPSTKTGKETWGEPSAKTGKETSNDPSTKTGKETWGEPSAKTGKETSNDPSTKTGKETCGEPSAKTGKETGSEHSRKTGKDTGNDSSMKNGKETCDNINTHTGTSQPSAPPKSILWDYLKRRDREGVIGLSALIECHTDGQSPLYLCQLCKYKVLEKNIIAHVTGDLHQVSYLQSLGASMAPRKRRKVRKAASHLEKTEGYGEAQVAEVDEHTYNLVATKCTSFDQMVTMVLNISPSPENKDLVRPTPQGLLPQVRNNTVAEKPAPTCSKAPDRGPLALLKYLKRSKRPPVIGLSMLTELTKKDSKKDCEHFLCRCCSHKMFASSLIGHLISLRHRYFYIKLMYPEMAADWPPSSALPERDESLHKELRERSAELEAREGPGKLQVTDIPATTGEKTTTSTEDAELQSRSSPAPVPLNEEAADTKPPGKEKKKMRKSNPVVGVNFLVQVSHRSRKQYFCQLCSVRMKFAVKEHMTSVQHRHKYVKLKYPSWTSVVDKKLFKMAVHLEKLDRSVGMGMQKVEVEVDDFKDLDCSAVEEALSKLQAIITRQQEPSDLRTALTTNHNPEELKYAAPVDNRIPEVLQNTAPLFIPIGVQDQSNDYKEPIYVPAAYLQDQRPPGSSLVPLSSSSTSCLLPSNPRLTSPSTVLPASPSFSSSVPFYNPSLLTEHSVELSAVSLPSALKSSTHLTDWESPQSPEWWERKSPEPRETLVELPDRQTNLEYSGRDRLAEHQAMQAEGIQQTTENPVSSQGTMLYRTPSDLDENQEPTDLIEHSQFEHAAAVRIIVPQEFRLQDNFAAKRVDGPSHLSKYLRVNGLYNTDPIIGLGKVLECRCLSRPTFFICVTCAMTLSTKNICEHIISTRHQDLYMYAQYNDLLVDWHAQMKQPLTSYLREFAWKVSQLEVELDAMVMLLDKMWYTPVMSAPYNQAMEMLRWQNKSVTATGYPFSLEPETEQGSEHNYRQETLIIGQDVAGVPLQTLKTGAKSAEEQLSLQTAYRWADNLNPVQPQFSQSLDREEFSISLDREEFKIEPVRAQTPQNPEPIRAEIPVNFSEPRHDRDNTVIIKQEPVDLELVETLYQPEVKQGPAYLGSVHAGGVQLIPAPRQEVPCRGDRHHLPTKKTSTVTLTSYIKNKRTEPLVGLSAVIECCCDGFVSFYLCVSCGGKLSCQGRQSTPVLINHLLKYRHRQNYLTLRYPWFFHDLVPGQSSTEQSRILMQIAKEVEEQNDDEPGTMQEVLLPQADFEEIRGMLFDKALARLQEICKEQSRTDLLTKVTSKPKPVVVKQEMVDWEVVPPQTFEEPLPPRGVKRPSSFEGSQVKGQQQVKKQKPSCPPEGQDMTSDPVICPSSPEREEPRQGDRAFGRRRNLKHSDRHSDHSRSRTPSRWHRGRSRRCSRSPSNIVLPFSYNIPRATLARSQSWTDPSPPVCSVKPKLSSKWNQGPPDLASAGKPQPTQDNPVPKTPNPTLNSHLAKAGTSVFPPLPVTAFPAAPPPPPPPPPKPDLLADSGDKTKDSIVDCNQNVKKFLPSSSCLPALSTSERTDGTGDSTTVKDQRITETVRESKVHVISRIRSLLEPEVKDPWNYESQMFTPRPGPNIQIPNVNIQIPSPSVQNTSPNIEIQNPHHNIQNPSINLQNPSINVQNPNINIQNPSINVQNPNFNIQNPSIHVQNPNFNVQSPNFNVQSFNPTANATLVPCVYTGQMTVNQVTSSPNSPYCTDQHPLENYPGTAYPWTAYFGVTYPGAMYGSNTLSQATGSGGYWGTGYPAPGYTFTGQSGTCYPATSSGSRASTSGDVAYPERIYSDVDHRYLTYPMSGEGNVSTGIPFFERK
ncbi:hypothetical protein UPYG_G00335220 [Umbra pygmaea]|uniref:C2H2-type domain-containing protein n=1 Tax=Umbra pygmaea TaxID=75934 RepID=A0ABD0W070_UMBPY